MLRQRFFWLFFYLILLSNFAPLFVFAESTNDRVGLEQQLADIEGQITQYESTVSAYRKQGKGLQVEIARIDTNVRKTNLQIRAIEAALHQLDIDIVGNKQKIIVTEGRLSFERDAKKAADGAPQGVASTDAPKK